MTRASVTRPSITQGASLAATPRPAGAKTAGDRVTMIARLACWGAIFGYIAVLTLRLLILYGG